MILFKAMRERENNNIPIKISENKIEKVVNSGARVSIFLNWQKFYLFFLYSCSFSYTVYIYVYQNE